MRFIISGPADEENLSKIRRMRVKDRERLNGERMFKVDRVRLSLASRVFAMAGSSFGNEMKGRTQTEMVGVSGCRCET
jgi:hypothetical protein